MTKISMNSFLIEEELSFTKFKSNIILMKSIRLNVQLTYSNDTSCARFIGVIADTDKKTSDPIPWVSKLKKMMV